MSEANGAGSADPPAAIDVALPYYGDVDLMKQAVRSVLGQQFQDWRLFVVDDGFPDPEPARWFVGRWGTLPFRRGTEASGRDELPAIPDGSDAPVAIGVSLGRHSLCPCQACDPGCVVAKA